MHQRDDEQQQQQQVAAADNMAPDSGGWLRFPPSPNSTTTTTTTKLDDNDGDKNVHNASWLLDEMERLWFHDNVVDFHVGSWIASFLADACSPPMPSSTSSSLPRVARIAVAQPGLIAHEIVDLGLRPLRDRGKVFSTGDLSRARLKKLPCGDEDEGAKLVLDEQEQSPTTPISSRLQCSDLDSIEGFECKVQTLETIPSDSPLTLGTSPSTADAESSETPTRPRRRRRRERRKLTKSLSELEFDEIRGFRDLGFKLNQDNLTPRMVSLIPALSSASPTTSTAAKHSGGLTSSNSDTAAAAATTGQIERIYPSHAWNIRRPDSPLLNLRIPNPNREGVDMKAHLRFWARAVASTVRQEC